MLAYPQRVAHVRCEVLQGFGGEPAGGEARVREPPEAIRRVPAEHARGPQDDEVVLVVLLQLAAPAAPWLVTRAWQHLAASNALRICQR